MLLTAFTNVLLQQIIKHLQLEFAIKDIGDLHFFLGIHVTRTPFGFFLSQAKYAEDLLDRASMTNCKPISTPLDNKRKYQAPPTLLVLILYTTEALPVLSNT